MHIHACKYVSFCIIIIFSSVHLFTGNARVMGQAAVSVQHFQDGAEEESPGGAGRSELLRHHQQGTAGAQNEVHDQHQAAQ